MENIVMCIVRCAVVFGIFKRSLDIRPQSLESGLELDKSLSVYSCERIWLSSVVKVSTANVCTVLTLHYLDGRDMF